MSGPELEAHAYALADELGARLWVLPMEDVSPDGLGCALVDEDGSGHVFLTHPPDTHAMYLLALHELGHLAHARGSRRPFKQLRGKTLFHEALAWQWAVENVGIVLSPAEWEEIRWRMATYASDARYAHDETFSNLYSEVERKATWLEST